MNAEVVLLPGELGSGALARRTVIVLDVLRATTTMAAALNAGVQEIRVFDDIGSARRAAEGYEGRRLLCGEVECLPPPGFDLGNSPGAFNEAHAGFTVFMATTNGTRAIVAARGAEAMLTGALVNAASVARHAAEMKRAVTILCAGTRGQIAMEDFLAAGAILDELSRLAPIRLDSDRARLALRFFRSEGGALREVLADSQGGRNVIGAGLEADIDFCARLNAIAATGRVEENPLRVVPAEAAV